MGHELDRLTACCFPSYSSSVHSVGHPSAQESLAHLELSLSSRRTRYEVARGEPPKDATYFANAHVLLHDDTCFRFASLPGNQVSFQMMDPDKSEVPAGAPAILGQID